MHKSFSIVPGFENRSRMQQTQHLKAAGPRENCETYSISHHFWSVSGCARILFYQAGTMNIRKSAYATMKFSSIAPAHDDSTKSEGSLSSQLLS